MTEPHTHCPRCARECAVYEVDGRPCARCDNDACSVVEFVPAAVIAIATTPEE